MTSTLGPKISVPTWTGYTVGQNDNSARAVVYTSFVAPSAGWLTRVGVYARKNNNSPKLTLAVYSLDAGGNPSRLLGQTPKLTLTTGGGNFEGALDTPALMDAGEGFALAAIVDGGTAEYAQAFASTKVWRRQMGSGIPTDPYGATSIVFEIGMGIYAEFQPNSQPSVTLTSPADGATLNTTTPTFTGAFVDADIPSPTLDYLAQYQIQVRLAGSTGLVWSGGPFVASPSESTNNAFSRLYSGASLVPGNSYEWRASVADTHGVWSAWSAWRTFTLNAIGFVDVSAATSPAAKVDGDTTLIDWGGTWTHPLGQGAIATQVRILDDTGVVVKTGGIVAQTIANGAAFTVPHASAGIGTITPGVYSYEIQAQASGGLWSAWSAPKAFVVNSPPTTPSDLQPPSGASSTSYPLLEWNIDDPDADDIYGVDDNSEIELTRPNGSVITILTLNYDLARGKGFYQLGATELPITGTYKWRVRGNDLSAGTAGVGQWSAQQTFSFVAGPVVTITSPSANQVVTTSAPTITWSAPGQVRYQVKLYNADAKLAFKDSGQVTSAAGIFSVPAGWLKNLGAYDVDVTVWDVNNISGTSLRQPFTVLYTAPNTPAVLNASLIQNARDYEASSVLLTWNDSDLPPGEFAGWLIWRREATDDPDDAILLTTIPSAAQRQWIDYNAPPNVPVVYGLSQLRNAGTGAVLESGVVETEIDVPLQVATLVSLIDGRARRVSLMWLDTDLKGSFKRPQALYQTWGSQGKNQQVTTPAAFGAEPITLSFTLRTDRDINGALRGTRQEHFEDVEALVKSGDPMCLRLEHKRLFCVVGDYSWNRGPQVGTTVIQLALEEIDYREGQSTEGLT
jgi:hypothetical protein